MLREAGAGPSTGHRVACHFYETLPAPPIAAAAGPAKGKFTERGVTTEQFMPEIHYRVPHLRIRWDESKVKATVKDIIRELRDGTPSIEVRSNTNEGLELGVWMLKPGEDAIVAQRVHEVLSAHRA